jgi:flavin-dependent dehydrogenase
MVKVHIIGAGLSGMIAAYNLAREGHEVLVLDKGPAIGGTPPHHPSNHATPLAVDWIWNYIGIDLSALFHEPKGGSLFIAKDRFSMPRSNFIVERGPRETSIDFFLHRKCQEAGVAFEFGRDIRDPFDMPDPTIIATGLHRDMGRVLDRPLRRLSCVAARRRMQSDEHDCHNFAWMGSYTATYGYASMVNKLEYYLLFSEGEITRPDLRRFEDHLERSIGVRFERWVPFEVWVPTARPDAPRLITGSKILAGTIAGMICPSAYFGIQGALLSGRIAALAVSDPEAAAREMERMTANYRSAYRSRRLARLIPQRRIRQLVLKHPSLGRLLPVPRSGIPGMADEPPGPLPRYEGRI